MTIRLEKYLAQFCSSMCTRLLQMATELIHCIILLSQLDSDNAASIAHLISTFEEGELQRNPNDVEY